MSTRAQVQVIAEDGKEDWEKVTLYHHSDGYPTYMLNGFAQAWDKAIGYCKGAGPTTPSPFKLDAHKAARFRTAGGVAALLCHSEPFMYEPEVGHELHGDIRYYYKLWVSRTEWRAPTRGRVRQKALPATAPHWSVQVFAPDMYELSPRLPIKEAARRGRKIEVDSQKVRPEDA